LLKAGVVKTEDVLKVAFIANPAVNQAEFDSVEKFGCYYFDTQKSSKKGRGQIFIGPAGLGAPKQKLPNT
jgi:hypothetical protein